ncbi:MAG: hypothetical protein HY042_03560 [Spirochaetia bacterium]|nr:hypothetical protein [Spirochaetia bacterium]
MNRTAVVTAALVLCLLPMCRSGQNDGRRNDIPLEMKKNGMVSSSTYQVFVTVVANSEQEALKLADSTARQKAFNLMVQEPFMPRQISDFGQKEVRKLIETNGKMVKFVKDNETSWSAVLHITKEGLRGHLQNIR